MAVDRIIWKILLDFIVLACEGKQGCKNNLKDVTRSEFEVDLGLK
ncbi:hypothetical protein KGM_214347 [Danaus plexippus plexippus]|uniref:Uncharacterized protein n=1 Tax=Danaus plexippus plexippus TaxID=278856 RepID=A0A212FNK7_DANPL|nr:hypothetical protein KGM_214347 [Danaus plexippus plexippus]